MPRPDGLLPLEAKALRIHANGHALLDGIDLCIEAGRFTIVMGPNGAGKSLLLRVLHGLIAPSSGVVTWNGRAADESVRRQQAMVFQHPVLLRRTAAGNLDFALSLRGLGRGERRAERDAWLERVGLRDRADTPARRLSGGEQQRLSLARALALQPDMLFLDEPTASLDPASTAAIEAIVLDGWHAGLGAMWVSHDVGQARRLARETRLAGSVLFLHHGRVCEHSPAEEFFDQPRSEEARRYLDGRIVL